MWLAQTDVAMPKYSQGFQELDFQHQEFCDHKLPGQRSLLQRKDSSLHFQQFSKMQRVVLLDALRADIPSSTVSYMQLSLSEDSMQGTQTVELSLTP